MHLTCYKKQGLGWRGEILIMQLNLVESWAYEYTNIDTRECINIFCFLLASEILKLCPVYFWTFWKWQKLLLLLRQAVCFDVLTVSRIEAEHTCPLCEMSTVEKRFLFFKIYAEKYLLYWQRIAIWAVATSGTKTSSCISLRQWMSRDPGILTKTGEKESTSKCSL